MYSVLSRTVALWPSPRVTPLVIHPLAPLFGSLCGPSHATRGKSAPVYMLPHILLMKMSRRKMGVAALSSKSLRKHCGPALLYRSGCMCMRYVSRDMYWRGVVASACSCSTKRNCSLKTTGSCRVCLFRLRRRFLKSLPALKLLPASKSPPVLKYFSRRWVRYVTQSSSYVCRV